MNRIRDLRISKGLKQSDLAALIGVRQNTLSTWETGRYEPDMQALRKMASVFGVSIDYIVGESDENRLLLLAEPQNDKKSSQAAAPKGNGLTEEFARIFEGLTPENQTRIIAEMLKAMREQ